MPTYSLPREKCAHHDIQLESTSLAKMKENEDNTELGVKKCVCHTNYIVRSLRGYFERHGRYVAKHPYPFFIIPLIVTGCLSYGLWHLEVIEDVERLFAPRNGVSKMERQVAAEYFHEENQERFLPGRGPYLDGFLDIIIIPHDRGSVLRREVFQSVIDLEEKILNVTARDGDGNVYSFLDICGNWKGACVDHPILMAYGRDPDLVEVAPITYPNFGYLFLGLTLGNVTTHPRTSVVEYAGVTRLTFFVLYESWEEQDLANRWFAHAEGKLHDLQDPRVLTYHCATNSLEVQFDTAMEEIMPQFAAPFVLLVVFSVLSCMMKDWVLSKPYLAFVGLLSTAFSLGTTFGLLSLLGIGAPPYVGLVPFLTLEVVQLIYVSKRGPVALRVCYVVVKGVGVDNIFILIAAWRRSSNEVRVSCEVRRLSVQEIVQLRMGQAMKDAAQSITITSFTDILAFSIGIMSEFFSVQMLVLYCGVSIFFAYIYCITFFAAAMVFSGWREEANRHCFSLRKVVPCDQANNAGRCYRAFCAGGDVTHQDMTHQDETTHSEVTTSTPEVMVKPHDDTNDHIIMRFFRDWFGPVLMKPYSKVVVLLLDCLYVAGALYGCLHVRSEFAYETVANQNSYLSYYYKYRDVYFNEYGMSVGIIVSGQSDYSDAKIQRDIYDIIDSFTNESLFFSDDNTICWLFDYLAYLENVPRKIKTGQDFIDVLRYQFLNLPGTDRYSLDIKFNADYTGILATRCHVQSRWYRLPENVMVAARRTAASIAGYNVTAYNSHFIFLEQPLMVWRSTLLNLLIALICIFLVSVSFAPTPLSALWVTLATACIECGVIGYMTLWGVNVDVVSMTYLILCIGFSVDFAVHITYGFIAADGRTANAKAVEALHVLGYPILQSAASTIIAVIFLCSSVAYFFLSFYKTMVLVIAFGVWHALFVLPVMLSFWGNHREACKAQPCRQCDCITGQSPPCRYHNHGPDPTISSA